MVGLISLKEGKIAPPGQEVVAPGFKGIQHEVLTPGSYKINPHRYEITPVPAVVVPPGSVGVVTRLVVDVGHGPVVDMELQRSAISAENGTLLLAA